MAHASRSLQLWSFHHVRRRTAVATWCMMSTVTTVWWRPQVLHTPGIYKQCTNARKNDLYLKKLHLYSQIRTESFFSSVCLTPWLNFQPMEGCVQVTCLTGHPGWMTMALESVQIWRGAMFSLMESLFLRLMTGDVEVMCMCGTPWVSISHSLTRLISVF